MAPRKRSVQALVVLCSAWAALAGEVVIEPPKPRVGDRLGFVACDPSGVVVTDAFVHSTAWDLSRLTAQERHIIEVVARDTTPSPRAVVPEPRWVAARVTTEPVDPARGPRHESFRYYAPDPRIADSWNLAAWDEPGAGGREVERRLVSTTRVPGALRLGESFVRTYVEREHGARPGETLLTETASVVAEGILITHGGPQETLLVRIVEGIDRAPFGSPDGGRVVYRWVADRGEVALLAGPEGVLDPYFGLPARAIQLLGSDAIEDNITIRKSRMPLTPLGLFISMYYTPATTPLATINPAAAGDPAWTSAGVMIDNFSTRTDPETGLSQVDTWDFTRASLPAPNGGIDYTPFTEDVVITVRNDTTGIGCPTQCSARDLTGTAALSWQYYLKFHYWARPMPALPRTRDVYMINDNDTTSPALELTFLSQDELSGSLPTSTWTQVCFGRTPGPGKLLKYLQFKLDVGGGDWAMDYDPSLTSTVDNWMESGWSGCDADTTALSVRSGATGCFVGGTGAGSRDYGSCTNPDHSFAFEIVEDGYFRAPTGNMIKALLVRQHTALEPGIPFIFPPCLRDANQNQANWDYWWFAERYGILARVSSPNNPPCTDTATSWTSTDGAYVSFGLFPPAQVSAQGCLGGKVRVSWTRPLVAADERLMSGWRVRWGTAPGVYTSSIDLPLTTTFHEITTAVPIYAVVTSRHSYTDPELVTAQAYESPRSYEVTAAPAPACPGFAVGNNLGDDDGSHVPDAVTKVGSNVYLPWEAVACTGTTIRYRIMRGTNPNPATHVTYQDDLTATTFTTTDGSGGDGNDYYWSVLAKDACDLVSPY